MRTREKGMSHLAVDRARQAYQVSQLHAEDSMGLIVRLYDGMLSFLEQGATHLDERDFASAATFIRKGGDIIGELQAVLNMEEGGEISSNLDRIYAYCRRRLMESHIHTDSEGLREVVRLLEPLRDAWVEARAKILAEGGA